MRIILEESMLLVLAAAKLPNNAANTWKDKMDYLTMRHGNFLWQSDYRNGRAAIESLVATEYGVAPPAGVEIGISRKIKQDRVTKAELATAFNLAASLNLYFELIEWPAFVQLTNAQYDDNVPNYLPHAVDGDDNPIQWQNWKDATHEHRTVGTTNYVPLESWGHGVAGSILKTLSASFTINPMSQYPAGE